jgi:hypothetical protein
VLSRVERALIGGVEIYAYEEGGQGVFASG